MNLTQANKAKTYLIIHITGYSKCRLLEMGFTRLQNIVLINKVSDHGPYEVLIRNYKLALNEEEAICIFIEEHYKND